MPAIVPLPKCSICGEPASTTFPPHVGVNKSSTTIHLCHDCLKNRIEKLSAERKEEGLLKKLGLI